MFWVLAAVAGLGAIGTYGWIVYARGIETPAYAVTRSDGAIEVRDYPEMIAASLRREGPRGEAVRSAFGPLARYIFGRERTGDHAAEKIAMTAPVTQTAESIAMTAPVTQSPGEGGWTISFIMPAEYELADLPVPSDPVRLERWPAQRAAAIRFSGRWTDARFAAKTGKLMVWIEAEGLTPAGPPTYAYYNDPFTPFFLRRNEVIVPLEESS